MPLPADDIGRLLDDLGALTLARDVTVGATTVKGIVRRAGEEMTPSGFAVLVGVEVVVTVKTGALPGLAHGVDIVADGVTYKAREILQAGEGSLTKVSCVLP